MDKKVVDGRWLKIIAISDALIKPRVCPSHQPAVSPINVSQFGGHDKVVWDLHGEWLQTSLSIGTLLFAPVRVAGKWEATSCELVDITQWHDDGADALCGMKDWPMCHCSPGARLKMFFFFNKFLEHAVPPVAHVHSNHESF